MGVAAGHDAEKALNDPRFVFGLDRPALAVVGLVADIIRRRRRR
jgi:hypothetical protein